MMQSTAECRYTCGNPHDPLRAMTLPGPHARGERQATWKHLANRKTTGAVARPTGLLGDVSDGLSQYALELIPPGLKIERDCMQAHLAS